MSNWKTTNPPFGEYIQLVYLIDGGNLSTTVAKLEDGVFKSIDPTNFVVIQPDHVQKWRHIDECDQYIDALSVLDAVFSLVEAGEIKPTQPSAVWAFRFAKQVNARIRANNQ